MRTPIEKGLASTCTPRLVEHLEGVARAVADRQHDVIGLEVVAAVEVQPADMPLAVGVGRDIEPVDARPEAIFAAQALDRLAQAFDHRHQPEGADMRVRLGQDFGRRAGLDELGQHLAVEDSAWSLIRL